jgi:diguanylate cyclase (GGDEF)-like protein
MTVEIKLLIIDDDRDQRELLCETLNDHFGPGTAVAVDGRESALAQDLASFSLILTDYNLTECTGMDVLELIRDRCSTPVIMVTGENVGNIAIEAIARGATDYVVKVGDYLLTLPLVIEKNLALARMKAELEAKNAMLVQLLGQVERAAATDPLTGLYNRRHFAKVLDQMFAEASRHEKDLSCVMLDLDKYKQLNDTFGHQIGDQLLVLAGKTITACLRRMDVAARYGGDEFVLLFPQSDAQEASLAIDRIRDEFRASSAALLNNAGVNMSVGIAAMRQHQPASADQLVALADAALYRAKDAGRNRVAIAPTPAQSRTASLVA